MPDSTEPRPRLASIDAFRGLTILGMLLVNNAAMGAATPAQLVHAGWANEVHFADLVFPWFLLASGISLALSWRSHSRAGTSLGSFVGRTARRAVVLVLLGCLLDSAIAHAPRFGLGVLQVIGLAGLTASFLAARSMRERALAASGLLLVHWALLRFVPAPGEAMALFAPGRTVVAWLDRTWLEPLHLRGLVSLVPTTALVLLGTLVGDCFLRQARASARAATLGLAGGLALLLATAWSQDLPCNKPLWTAPYILHAAGLGTLVLAALHLLADRPRGSWPWIPLQAVGTNAIAAYVLPILVKVWILQEWIVPTAEGTSRALQAAWLAQLTDRLGPVDGGWAYTLAYVLAWWLVLLEMHRRRIVWKV